MARYRTIIPQNLMPRTGMPISQSRGVRTPNHEAQFRIPPWNIYPMAFAPVLPGDRFQEVNILGRIVTDPVDGKMLPWWYDLFVFYCPWRATAASSVFQNMALGNGGTNFIFNGGTAYPTVTGGGFFDHRVNARVNMGKLYYDAIITEFFRDEGDDAADFVDALTGMAMMKLGRTDWTDSLIPTSTLTSDDVNVDINNNSTIMASEVQLAMRSYELLRQGNFTEMTFEEWCSTFGLRVRAPDREIVPKLLGHKRAFQYPSNTVTQGTGAVTSAVSWSVNETVRDRTEFKEPGALVVLCVVRPKIYRRPQVGSVINLMDNAYMWLPAVLRDDPASSLAAMDTVSGMLGSVTPNSGNYTFDLKDYFVYGEQTMYIAPSVAGADSVAAGSEMFANIPSAETTKLPSLGVSAFNSNSGNPDYPANTLAQRLNYFVGTTNEASLIQGEMTCRFQISSTVMDQTPGTPAR